MGDEAASTLPSQAGQRAAVLNASTVATHHAPPSEWTAIILSYALILWLFGAQLAIVWWKKTHPDQFRLFTLVGLLVLPPVFAIMFHNWRFIACCFLFITQAAYTVWISTRKPLDPDTPQFVFRFFLVMHRITFAMGVLGAGLFCALAFFIIPLTNYDFPILLQDSVLLAFYVRLPRSFA